MSIAVSIDHLQGKERKEIIKTVQQQAKNAALEAIRPLFGEFLDAEVEIKLGRKKGVHRHIRISFRHVTKAERALCKGEKSLSCTIFTHSSTPRAAVSSVADAYQERKASFIFHASCN